MERRGGEEHQPATVLPPEDDAPLRRAVAAGHTGDVSDASALARHRDPAVRAAALGAQERLGVLGVDEIAVAAADGDAGVRRRACAVAGRLLAAGPPSVAAGLVAVLVEVLSADPDWTVVEAAAAALGEAGPVHGRLAVPALVRVATGHGDALCREAAVAALGAVGDPGGLDAVLGALDDKPAVRRRAAVALAAFDDARAEAGLRRCLEDRDWQVRQAAEDLLDRRGPPPSTSGA